MEDFKPKASLSSGLLARKGGARPAMRSQFPSLFGVTSTPDPEESLEDLGWNDMGEDQPDDGAVLQAEAAAHHTKPQVVQDRESIIERFTNLISFDRSTDLTSPVEEAGNESAEAEAAAEQREDRSVSLLSMSQPRQARYRGGRERSFTLRMSDERYSRLRESCRTRQCSAQLLVTEALDHFLNKISNIQDMKT